MSSVVAAAPAPRFGFRALRVAFLGILVAMIVSHPCPRRSREAYFFRHVNVRGDAHLACSLPSRPTDHPARAMRYLAELPWAPHAMRLNRQLQWKARDRRTVEVSARVRSQRGVVQLEFDASGDIRAASAVRAYRQRDMTKPMPWRGIFSDYATVGGVRIPTRAEVRWELPEGAFTYWRGRITSLEGSATSVSLP